MENKKQEEMLNAMESSMQRFFHKETENKMTPKQALEELRKECNAQFFDENGKKWYTTGKHLDYRCNIIDQALTEYEKQKQILEVLKSKKVNVHFFIDDIVEYNRPYETYVLYFRKPIKIDFVIVSEELLTETEFNLIKEWLK